MKNNAEKANGRRSVHPGKSHREINRRRHKISEKHKLRRKEKNRRRNIRKQESERRVVFHLHRTIVHFFPNLFDYIREIEDYRSKSEYSLTELIVSSIAMFIFISGSRNEFNNLREDGKFRKNYEKLFKLRLPHPDTADNVMRHLPEEALEKLKQRLIYALIEKRSLHKYRFMDKYFIIAVDGTGIVSFDKQHCSQCLHKTSKKGKTTYFHNVLEAKLITSNGFSISIVTEWIENPGESGYDKQDCERKAFKRLAEKLKKSFPRLPICITADGLYPYEGFFDTCRGYGWKYIVTFKDGSLPSIQEEVAELLPLMSENKRNETFFNGNTRTDRHFLWVKGLSYRGNGIHWIQCTETVRAEGKEPEVKKFVHLTDIEPDYRICFYISEAGRLRWKIENEGFNSQKNNGYRLKHKYSRVSYRAMKNYYQCLQIAHMINQLLIYSTEFQNLLKGKITIRHLWFLLIGKMVWDDIDLPDMEDKKIQIRFAT